MKQATQERRTFPASERERASIRALKNWMLSAPGENPFEDQLVRVRIAAAIAEISSAALDHHQRTGAPQATGSSQSTKS
ncbi:hypothetical protein [Pseudorhodoplanes sp.]|uniref:hypothetical protein n=1 Tax=Pseudorhodoplanes sp. TaxID=1934341 RepID=UPI002C75A550|nr:hypothetical protein [Pseudorhodoplanes sp.]HWV54060.1 hypothetical protein [Pseudorhodoplanes sp.]